MNDKSQEPKAESDARPAPISVEEINQRGHRLTVNESVYHQLYGEQPSQIENHFSRFVESDEEPYSRRRKATEEWQPLDIGWVKEIGVGMLVISSLAGKALQRNPTKEEKEETAKQILEVSYTAATPTSVALCWLIPPGESMRGMPSHGNELWIRSRHGTVRYTVFVIPK